MNYYTGHIIEIQLERYKKASALVSLPTRAIPKPGQFLQANQPGQSEEVLATSLFPSGISLPVEKSEDSEVLVWGDLPVHWEAGTPLVLRGPIGNGFALPKNLKRLALVALGQSPGRLLPLIPLALDLGAEVALFSGQAIPELPLAVEVRSLSAVQEAGEWADFLAIDCPVDRVEHIPKILGVDEDFPRQVIGQVLLTSPMPCGGLAQCGICTAKLRKKEKLICEYGPVFSLRDLIA